MKQPTSIYGELEGDQHKRLPKRLPKGMRPFKSSTHVVLTYDAVKFILEDRWAETLHKILQKQVFMNEEHFFALLHYNVNITHFPGSHWINEGASHPATQFEPRYKKWQVSKKSRCISGRIRHYICVVGAQTLPELVNTFYGTALYVNKFIWTFQSLSWDCMMTWHHSKVDQELKRGAVSSKFLEMMNADHSPILNIIHNNTR